MFAAAVAVFSTALVVSAQRRDVFVQSRNHPAIAYATAPVSNAAARLAQQLESGALTFTGKPDNGFLIPVLEALKIPVESQSLVFSQTSLQGTSINVRNPRAIYFNDTVAVGWVRGERQLEIAAQDARQGVVFYTLDQQATTPRLKRNDDCLACHLSWENLGVPGMMMQSVNPLPDEISYVVGFTTNHASPFVERFGGWYVTGAHGKQRHMGNIPVMPQDKGKLAVADPRELESVKGLFDLRGFPTPYSDVAALMVLAHQTAMTNYITRVGWEARLAEAAPGNADAAARVREGARDLVDYLLFVDEAPLLRPVQSTSGFAAKFTAQGPRDSKGRSLHDLDLQKRLLRYPCSYMIYTPAFEALPRAAKDAVYARMWEILSGKDTDKRYTRMAAADRAAVVEILRETKKDLPAYFKGL